MTQRNRRQFLEESMLAAAAAAATASGVDRLLAAPIPASRSANEQLGVAVIGVRGRGNSHLSFYASRRDTRVLYVCDVDSTVGTLRAQQVARRQGGSAPARVEDLRRVLEDPRVDIVSIATPNHWHALATIWAMQAGKDVYVEMPVSHNVQEGRRMVEAARRYQRVCQSGLQARSNPGMIEAIQFLHAGGIGTVCRARGLCYQRAGTTMTNSTYPLPPHVDYGLWLGPAPAAPLTRGRFHYDWRWQWPYGNGALGNQGVHQLDICRWGLQLQTIGQCAFSYGGRLAYHDDARSVDTQVSIHVSGDQSIVLETRSLESRPPSGVRAGVIFEGSDGYLVMTSYHSGTAFDRDGRCLRHFRGGGGGEPHFTNFVQAARQRSCRHLNGDVEEGHLSSALAHTANISYRLGCRVAPVAVQPQLADLMPVDPMPTAMEQTTQVLAEQVTGLDVSSLRLGKVLACDAQAERFLDDQRANFLLTRRYRRPFVVPSASV